ncbi:ABC transporter permease [Dactylosporangium sp. CA-233914]|uniref:ABC transporter permease n=1 Tax=Dactylosporangium sp. CA-233914 TaxID=3239934 RepID=UPI003D938D1F
MSAMDVGKATRRPFGWLLPLATLAGVLALLEILARTDVINKLIFPAPTAVVEALITLGGREFFWRNLWVTAIEALSGFAIGGSLGFLSGTIIGLSGFARRSLYPLAVAIQSTPQVAIAPLFLIWFGFGLAPRIFFAATTCFFPVLVAVVVGLNAADQDSRTLLRSLGASRLTTYRRLLLPASLPTTFSGIRTAVPLALVGAIVGEFVGGNLGLGVLITTFNAQLHVASSFAVVLVLAVMGFGGYALVELVDRRLLGWHHRRS